MNAPKLTKADLILKLNKTNSEIEKTTLFLKDNTFTEEEILELERVRNVINSIKLYDKLDNTKAYLEGITERKNALELAISKMNNEEIYSPL